MIMRLLVASYRAECPLRADSRLPRGVSSVHAGGPPEPFACDRIQRSPNGTLPMARPASPPYTMSEFVAGSYTAELLSRAGGGVPVGESFVHTGVERSFALLNTQTSLN